MLYRALSLSLLFSLSVSAGDKPLSPGHVEMAKGNPQNSPQMPQVEFQQPYVNQSPSSSNVGSNVGGSIVNVLLDLGKVEQPDIAKLRAAKVDEDFRAALAKYGPHVTAQFYPQYFDNMGNLKGSDPMADFVKFVSSRTPVATPTPSAPTVVPLPEAPKAEVPGNTSFTIFNPTKSLMPDDIIPHKPFIKPMPEAPAPAPTQTTTESQDPSLMMKMLKDGGEAAIVIGATMAAGYVAYKTGEGVYKGSRWLWRKAFGEAPQEIIQQAIPKSVHAQIEFHQNSGHCETPPKIKKKPGCLKAEAQLGDPRVRGLSDIEFPTDSSHIFRNEWGHFVHDTPETRGLLRDCYKKGTYHGLDGAGNHQYSMTNPLDGTQLWLKMREGGRISTAGCNEIHLPISKETGFLFKPDCWKNPTVNGVGCTFIGGSLAGMSSQIAKANIPEAVLFPVDKEEGVDDLNFFPFYYEGYTEQFHPGSVAWRGMPEAPKSYTFEFPEHKGMILPPAPKAITAEEVKRERASQMKYAVRMKKKNMEDYILMEEIRRRDKQQAKVLKDAFFKKDNI